MKVVTTEARGVRVCLVDTSILDASVARDFKAEIQGLLKPNVKLVLDLSEVDFIDSSGLGALVSCLRQAHSMSGEIKLSGLRKPVRALFELVRMHRVFEVFNGTDEAVTSYHGE
jgi:anti-sigma B factor antagonist